MRDCLLVVFIKNYIIGKVKNKLTDEIGCKLTEKVHNSLVEHTFNIVSSIDVPKLICYSDFVDNDFDWGKSVELSLQNGTNLGLRLKNVFDRGFLQGYKQIIVLGSETYDIDREYIESAFESLKSYDVAIGAANDGGCVLLGLTKNFPVEMVNKCWGREKIFENTYHYFKSKGYLVKELPSLIDIDTYQDIENCIEGSNLIKI